MIGIEIFTLVGVPRGSEGAATRRLGAIVAADAAPTAAPIVVAATLGVWAAAVRDRHLCSKTDVLLRLATSLSEATSAWRALGVVVASELGAVLRHLECFELVAVCDVVIGPVAEDAGTACSSRQGLDSRLGAVVLEPLAELGFENIEALADSFVRCRFLFWSLEDFLDVSEVEALLVGVGGFPLRDCATHGAVQACLLGSYVVVKHDESPFLADVVDPSLKDSAVVECVLAGQAGKRLHCFANLLQGVVDLSLEDWGEEVVECNEKLSSGEIGLTGVIGCFFEVLAGSVLGHSFLGSGDGGELLQDG